MRLTMTVRVQFTPLESLLIFQGLTAWGAQPDAFAKVSDSLNQCAFLRKDDQEVRERWSPRSVQHLYLGLLKAESTEASKDTTEADEAHANTNDASPSRKRKAASPTLPTLEEASKHAHLMPGLVAKLYLRYRDEQVKAIREDEVKYEVLVKDVDRFEENNETTMSDLRDATVPTKQQVLDTPQLTNEDVVLQGETAHGDSGISTAEPSSIGRDAIMQDAPQDPSAQLSDDLAKAGTPWIAAKEPSSIEFVKSLPTKEAGLDFIARDEQKSRPGALGKSIIDVTSPSHVLQPQQVALANQPTSPAHLHSPYESDHLAVSNSYGRPDTSLPLAFPSQSTPSRISGAAPLYPPQGPQNVQAQNVSAPHLAPNLLPRMQTGPEPHHTQQPGPHHTQQPGLQYMPQQPGGPWLQSSYNLQHPSQVYTPQPPRPVQPPHRGGIMLPPFQVSPQIPAPIQQQNRMSTSLLPSPYSMKIDTNVSASRTLNAVHTPVTAQRRPRSRLSQVSPLKPGTAATPGSGTVWRPLAVSQSPAPSPRPRSRHLSPFGRDIPNSSLQEVSNAQITTPKSVERKKRGRTSKAASKPLASDQSMEIVEDVPTPVKVKKAASRAASKTPSTAAASQTRQTRSQSLVSQPDVQSAVNAALEKMKFKDEPRTPTAPLEDHAEPDEPEKSVKLTKKGLPFKSRQAKVVKGASKASPPPTTPTGLSSSTTNLTTKSTTTILASRNFSKMTAPIMNNITSHKHASLFANPVKERDAEGYASMIRRPQDLKSIRNAISAGSRAVVAASALLESSNSNNNNNNNTSSTGSGNTTTDSPGPSSSSSASASSIIALPASADLLPPKGIVNAAQLEQEIMRMFANAVMFNPGDGGVVNDTKEMFNTVEPAVAKWRAADRTTVVDAAAAAVAVERGGAGAGVAAGGKGKVDEEADELGQDESVMANSSRMGLPAKRRRL